MATLEQIADALRKADAAGNVEDAKALASAYRQMQQAQAPNPDGGFDPMRDLPIPGTSHPTAPDYSYHSMIPGGDALNVFADAFGQNIPIVGPLATRAADAVGSNLAASITGRTPEDELARGQEMRQQNADANPIASGAGAVAGSVGPLMALGTTQLGGQALGMTGPLWQRMLAGGVSGATISGADSLARGESGQEALGQAGVGAGLGASIPLAERAIMPLARMLAGQSVPKPVQSVARNMERDRIDPAQVRQMLDTMGPDAVLSDLGPNLTRQAGAIASLPGEGQSVLRDALVRRQRGANARIQGDINDTLGPSPLPSAVQRDIRAGQQQLGPQYEQALRGASPVDTAPIANTLDSMTVTARGAVQNHARRIRDMLNVPGTSELSTDPGVLLATRHAIDDMFPTATGNNEIGFLTNIRRQVDEMLAQSVPGIKQVDAQFEELARQNTGIQTGQQVLDSGRTAPRPAEVEAMMTDGAVPQGLFIGPSGEPFRVSQGARAEIDRLVGTTGSNLTALKSALKGDGSWNRDRLVSLFGRERADSLLGILEREQTFQSTYNTVLQNSETAARTAAQKEAAPHQFGNTSTSLADLLLKAPQWAANTAAKGRSEATNAQIAQMLIGRPTSEMVDQMIAAKALGRGLIGSSAVPVLTNQ